jgi:hypothetical protein
MQTEATTQATFADLQFNDRGGAHPMGEQAKFFFPNGYGVSVIRGQHSYGGLQGLYELAVLMGDADDFELTYDTPITDDVEGHLSPDDVSRLMAEVAALSAAKSEA